MHALDAAYRATDYIVEHEPPFVLKVGVRSDRAAALLAARSALSGVFITAWNPFSTRVSDEENEAANRRLACALLAQGKTIHAGVGRSADGQWSEASYFAYPVSGGEALALCRAYRQAAVVFVDAEGMPSLLYSH